MTGPAVSVVLCTRDRAERLALALERLAAVPLQGLALELVVVDNGSSDHTSHVIDAFAARAGFPVLACFEPLPGLGRARNCGIAEARAELLVFTDDDCFFDPDYFRSLLLHFDAKSFGFGGGQILPVNADDDERVATLRLQEPRLIEPHAYVLTPGLIQGANMFFRREVFDRVGVFRSDMGAGTPFPCEDIEMACRASNGGFVGLLHPEIKVFHDHRRRRDSPEALAVIDSYALGRGAYFASLVCEGRVDALSLWMNKYLGHTELGYHHLAMLAREMRAAADFIECLPLQPGLIVPVQRR